MTPALKEVWRYRTMYLWMAPILLLVLFSTLYPVIFAIDYSLWRTNVFSKVEFVGLQNYINLFSDARFIDNLKISAVFTFGGIVITLVGGFSLALMLRDQARINSVYRTILLIPWVTTEVVLALMWRWLLNPQTSPVIYLMTSVGLPQVNLLQDMTWALITVTIINGWRAVGYALVMMLAGLSAIPKEIEEAAEVDGCNRWQTIRHMFLPLLKPTTLVCLIVLTISFFNIIVLVFDLTGGGPLRMTELLSIRLYKEGFQYFNISLASTLSAFMLVINLVLSAVYYRLIKTESYF